MNTIRGILAFRPYFISLRRRCVSADTEADLFETADARIERHRKSDVEIRVVDADGKPIPGAKVDVKQTNSAFLFGSNIFMWGRFGDSRTGRGLQAAVRGGFQLRHVAILLVVL